MIKSTSKVKVNIINTKDKRFVFAKSSLAKGENHYVITTTYFSKDEINNQIPLGLFQEKFTEVEIDYLFEQLKSIIGNLPFTQMLETGTELGLFQYLNDNEKFGIAPNSNGWEII